MPVEAAIYLKRYDFKRSVKQVLWRPMTLLVTLCCLTVITIGQVLRINLWEIMCKNITYF